MSEMIKTTTKICKSCKYSKSWLNKQEDYYCDYLLMTHMRRGCPVGQCDKYEKRTGKNK